MRFVAIACLILLTSCKASWHLKKAIEKGAIVKSDTVYQTVEVIRPEVKTDTLFKLVQGDTVYIEKDRLKIKYVRLAGDTV
jgi:hypothetical protein